jgi:phosphoglycolate phosphatase-like HAD superfamily hydrolase
MINNIKSLIFDCDGVILNSNKVKKAAYYKVAFSYYGDRLANLLVEYLEENTGKPREHFFTHFLNNLAPSHTSGPSVEELVIEVGEEIHKGLMECEISQSLFELRENTPDLKWLVVSGGVESELRDIFTKRSLLDLFDAGVYGGPMTKDEILNSLIKENKLEFPALFLGDSMYDHKAANRANIDFLFVSEWSDFKGWKNYCNENKILSIKSLRDLI